jgi:hypothetical protein
MITAIGREARVSAPTVDDAARIPLVLSASSA